MNKTDFRVRVLNVNMKKEILPGNLARREKMKI